MATVNLEKVSKVYPNGLPAVSELDLDVAEGELMVLVGPSGSGKTTALRMVAGLEDITSGTLRMGGKTVNDLPPKDRNVAMVFQNYALYPHMTVAQNIGFALKLRKFPKQEINTKVREAAQLLGLSDYLNSKPGQLSDGQRPRAPPAAGPEQPPHPQAWPALGRPAPARRHGTPPRPRAVGFFDGRAALQ